MDFPHMGVACHHIAPDLRALRIDSYIAFYRVGQEVVTVERVLHARVNVKAVSF